MRRRDLKRETTDAGQEEKKPYDVNRMDKIRLTNKATNQLSPLCRRILEKVLAAQSRKFQHFMDH